VPDAWLEKLFASVDSDVGELDRTLVGLGYTKADERVRCVFRTIFVRSPNWGKDPVDKNSFLDGYQDSIERSDLFKVTVLGDGTKVAWYRDHVHRPVMLLPKSEAE
jgi:hypothetical protein